MHPSTKIIAKAGLATARRWASSAANAADKDKYKVVVVGAGAQIDINSP